MHQTSTYAVTHPLLHRRSLPDEATAEAIGKDVRNMETIEQEYGSSGSHNGYLSVGAGEEQWVVTVDLENPNGHAVSTEDPHVRDLLGALSHSSPLASSDGSILILSLSVRGSGATAVPRAVENVWTALEISQMTGWSIVRSTLISHDSVALSRSRREPLRLLCASECATLLEISKQRVSQLRDSGDFPEPDALVSGKPSWLEGTIQVFKGLRRSGSS